MVCYRSIKLYYRLIPNCRLVNLYFRLIKVYYRLLVEYYRLIMVYYRPMVICNSLVEYYRPTKLYYLLLISFLLVNLYYRQRYYTPGYGEGISEQISSEFGFQRAQQEGLQIPLHPLLVEYYRFITVYYRPIGMYHRCDSTLSTAVTYRDKFIYYPDSALPTVITD